MNTSIFVLLLVLVVVYLWTGKKTESMSLTRYRPFMTGSPAPVDYDDNIAGIPDPNSHQVLPNVNQYANDLAFNPNNPRSANLMVDGRPIMDPAAYQYLGNDDGEVSGRN